MIGTERLSQDRMRIGPRQVAAPHSDKIDLVCDANRPFFYIT